MYVKLKEKSLREEDFEFEKQRWVAIDLNITIAAVQSKMMTKKGEEEEALASAEEYWREAKIAYAIAIAVFVVVGLVVNAGSIVLLSRRKQKSMFHTLLKVIHKDLITFQTMSA